MLPTFIAQLNLVSQSSPLELIYKVIAYAILAAALLSVAFVFYGGFRFIFSGGDEAKVKAATGTIRHAILGLIITILAVTIISLIGRFFGLDIVGTLLNSNEIITNIRGAIERLSGTQTNSLLQTGGDPIQGSSSASGSLDYNYARDF